MSTRFDIMAAKASHLSHIAAHHCKTGQGCPERLASWQAWMHTTSRWALEPGDDARQREQYHAMHASTPGSSA